MQQADPPIPLYGICLNSDEQAERPDMVSIKELTTPKGHYAVVMLCPRGSVIATLAGPIKGSKEAWKIAKEERDRIGKAGRRNARGTSRRRAAAPAEA